MEEEKTKLKEKLTPSLDNLENSIKLWWKNIRIIIDIYLWGVAYASIPFIVMMVLLGIFSKAGSTMLLDTTLKIGMIALISVAILFLIYFITRAYLGNFLLVKNNYQGKGREIFKETKKYFWPYIWLTILNTILILLWAMLLIIPGIVFSVFYSLAVYVFFFEDKRGLDAIKRSYQLVRGYFWPVFGRACLIGFVIWLVLMIFSIPADFVPEETPFSTIWDILIQVVSFLIGPITLIFSLSVYKDLVRIKK
jgi:hypothetical protein